MGAINIHNAAYSIARAYNKAYGYKENTQADIQENNA